MSAATVRIWESLVSNISNLRSNTDPGATAGLSGAVAADLQQFSQGPPLPKAVWKKLVLEKQVIRCT
jgi:hypothetical protein